MLLFAQGFNATAQADYCNIMGYCGFPRGDTQHLSCELVGEWLRYNGSAVPPNQQNAVCIPLGFPQGTNCPRCVHLRARVYRPCVGAVVKHKEG